MSYMFHIAFTMFYLFHIEAAQSSQKMRACFSHIRTPTHVVENLGVDQRSSEVAACRQKRIRSQEKVRAGVRSKRTQLLEQHMVLIRYNMQFKFQQ
jgi:hypothetical protein